MNGHFVEAAVIIRQFKLHQYFELLQEAFNLIEN